MAGTGILIVEDTNMVSVALKKTLEQAGYNVLGIATSGAEAVEKALTLRPDIILMDILLEGSMDGIEAAAIISGQFDVPIIYVSENLDDSTFARALASDAWGFLSKPARPGDIRYTIELALKRKYAESRLLRAAEAAHMGVWDWDLENNTITANVEWYALFRMEFASCPMTGTWYFDQVHPDDRLAMEHKILAALQTKDPFEITFRFLCGDGVYRWTKGSGATTKRDPDGRPLQASGVNLDVDEIMHQQRRIEHQALLLKQSEEIAGTGIIEYDVNLNRIFRNAFFSNLLGYPETGFFSYADMVNVIHPEDRDSFIHEGKRGWKEHCDVNWVGRLIRPNHKPCWIQARWHHFYHPDGTPDRSVGMATDITALHETEEKLRTTLEERNTLLKEVHHRVKNNLQILLSMVVLEEMKYQEELTTNTLAQLLLTETSSRIAAIANIHESLYQTNDFSGIPFREHLETIADDLFITGHFRPGMITCDVDGDDIQVALDQAVPLSLTVNEILINCRKHAFKDRETGRVTIRTHDEPDTICVCIADDGIGIPEGIDPATADSVGLSLIYRIVTRQLNGTVEVKNRNGTVWTIRVPKQEKNTS